MVRVAAALVFAVLFVCSVRGQITEEELVTVSNVSAIITWRTAQPLDGLVYYAPCAKVDRSRVDARGVLKESAFAFMVDARVNTSFHYIEIDSLIPGETYCYQVRSGEFVGESTRFSPGKFTTIVPPSGEYLFTFATLNDMHVGEKTAGLIVINNRTLTPGFEWEDENNPYWKFSNEASVRQINQKNVAFTVVKGDISSDYKEKEFQDAKVILDRLASPYYPMRGNHDRVSSSPQDYYKTVFGITDTYYSFDYKGFHFICLDSVNIGNGSPQIDDAQVSWLRADLAANSNKKTFLFLHHAVTAQAFIWSIPAEDREELLSLLENSPQVIGVFSGHSHRSKVTKSERVGIFFPETPASKEYPLGYSLYHVYTNGFIQLFYRASCTECLQWNSMTRQMFFGAAPFAMLGDPVGDRNFVYNF